MSTQNAVHPTKAQIEAFLADHEDGEPVFMLNLLKFKDLATYRDADGADRASTGRAAYDRYAAAFGGHASRSWYHWCRDGLRRTSAWLHDR